MKAYIEVAHLVAISEHLLEQRRITVPARIQQCEPAGDAVSYACYLDHLEILVLFINRGHYLARASVVSEFVQIDSLPTSAF